MFDKTAEIVRIEHLAPERIFRRIDDLFGHAERFRAPLREFDHLGHGVVFEGDLAGNVRKIAEFHAFAFEEPHAARRHVRSVVFQDLLYGVLNTAVRHLTERKHAQFVFQLIGVRAQALDQNRVKRTALAVQDHADRLVGRERRLIATLARERVVHVRDRDDLRGNGNVVPFQPVGIALSVITLVVPAAYFVTEPNERFVLTERNVVEHLCALDGVPLHDLELFRREFARFVQNLGRNGNLADVVQSGCVSDQTNVFARERIFVRHLDELFEQHFGDRVYVKHVHAAFAVAEFHDMGKNFDHQRIVFLFLVNLRREHIGHFALFYGQQIVARNAVFYSALVERTADVIDRAQIVRAVDVRAAGFGGDHDDGDRFDPALLIHHRKYFEPIHDRHDDIEQ